MQLSLLRSSYHTSKNLLFSSSNFRNILPRFYITKTRRTKLQQKNLTLRKIPKVERDLIPIQELLKIASYEKEKKNEQKRQIIIAKTMHNYSIKVPSNYYIMVINNLLSDKSNKLKSKYIELLNLIEPKELINNYYLEKESKIKLAYLTKLFAHNIRVFPNYIKNEEIYDIMVNYLFQKDQLIMRIEKNKKINILRRKLLNYKNEEKHDIQLIKKDIDSFTNSNFDLGDNLHDLNDSSFSYSFENKSDSINKVQNLIKDMSILLKNTINDSSDKNEEIIINKKNIIFDKYIDLKLLNNNKYKRKDIGKTKTGFNQVAFKENLIVSNLLKEKQKLKLPIPSINSKKEITGKFSKINKVKFKTIQTNETNELKLDNKFDINYKKNFNTISNNKIPINNSTKIIEKITKKSHVNTKNKFLYSLSTDKNNPPKEKIKNTIINVIKKYGLSKNKSVKVNLNIKLINRNDKDYNTLDSNNNINNQKDIILKRRLETLDINKKNIKDFISKQYVEGNMFSTRTNYKNKYSYSNIDNSKKPNNMLNLAQSERIQFNFQKFMKIRKSLVNHEKKKKYKYNNKLKE